MIGTYYFCSAVILSILLSFVVDMFDEWDRQRVEEDLLDRRRELEFVLRGEEEEGCLELTEEVEEPSPLNRTLVLDHSSLHSRSHYSHHRHHQPHLSHHSFTSQSQMTNTISSNYNPTQQPLPAPTTNGRLLKQALMIVFSAASLPLVCFAVTLPTMQRLVYGGAPSLLHEVLGMVWQKEYSLISLVKTTGDAGGWDTLLMVTFGLFVVVGPILRSVCLIMHVLLGLPVALLGDCIERPRHRTTFRMILYQVTSTFQRGLRPIIDALGAFCSWEVLIVAFIMIQLEMPSITDTIYQDDRCQEADPEYGRTCIEVQFNAMDNFLLVGVAWFALVAASSLLLDLAADGEERSLIETKKKYEYGQPIPQRRSNLNSDQSWKGALGGRKSIGDNINMDRGSYYSSVQVEEERDCLEEIVFV